LELVQKTVNLLPRRGRFRGLSVGFGVWSLSNIFEGKNVSWMRWFVAKWNVVALDTGKNAAHVRQYAISQMRHQILLLHAGPNFADISERRCRIPGKNPGEIHSPNHRRNSPMLVPI
jgi:hypothetical protein